MSDVVRRFARLRSPIAMAFAVTLLGSASLGQAKDIPISDLFNTGCIVAKSPANGCLLTNVSGPIAPGADGVGTREGRACGWNVLMLFAWGDLRIETARRNGGIQEVNAIDNETFSLVPGFYGITRHCTVVSGR